MRSLRKVGVVIFLICAALWCLVPVLAFAGEYGSIGGKLFDPLVNLFGVELAGKIMGGLIGIIGWIVARVILKKIPTSMQGIVGKIFWKIASGLFGDGVIMSQHKDLEFVKKELIKKHPLLQIDIKKL